MLLQASSWFQFPVKLWVEISKISYCPSAEVGIKNITDIHLLPLLPFNVALGSQVLTYTIHPVTAVRWVATFIADLYYYRHCAWHFIHIESYLQGSISSSVLQREKLRFGIPPEITAFTLPFLFLYFLTFSFKKSTWRRPYFLSQ